MFNLNRSLRMAAATVGLLVLGGCGVGAADVDTAIAGGDQPAVAEAALASSSISVIAAQSDLHFGGSVSVAFQTKVANPQGYISCQAASGGLGQFIDLKSNNVFGPLGPTPSWSSGAATCTVFLLEDKNNGNYHMLASTPPFSIAP